MPFVLLVIYILLFFMQLNIYKILLCKFIKYVCQHHKFVSAFYMSLALTLACEMLL